MANTTTYTLGVLIEAQDRASSIIEGVSDQIENVRTTASQAGQSLQDNFGKYAVAAGVAAVASVKFAGDFEKNMNNINTLFGDGGEKIAEYSDGIKDIIKNSPKSADEIGSAAYDVISAGITDTSDALSVLQSSNDLAIAGLSSVGEATNLATSAFNSFSSQGYDANQVSNILFKTVKNGKTTVSELASGFGGLAPIASAAGVQLDELMASTAALTTTGLPAAEAYTSLKAVITGIMKPSSQAGKAAEELGLNFSAAGLKSKGLTKMLEDIKVATKGDADEIGKLFGSVEALGAVLGLTSTNAEAFEGTLADMQNGVDDLSVAVEKQNEGFNAQVSILKNELSVAMIGIGEILLPLIKSVATFTKENEGLTKIIIGAGLAIGLTLAILGTMGFVITGVTTALTALKGAYVAVTGATWLFNAALWANPITWVVAGVIALIGALYLLYKNWDTVTEAIGYASDAFVDMYDNSLLLQIVLAPLVYTIKGIGAAWDYLVETFSNSGGIFGGIGNILIDTVLIPLQSIAKLIDMITGSELSLSISQMSNKIKSQKETDTLSNNVNLTPQGSIIPQTNGNNTTNQQKNDIKIDLGGVTVNKEEDIDLLTSKISEKLTKDLNMNNSYGINY